jgi:hypothetical protein
MKPPAARFLVTVLLFTGWIGYLAYQVLTRPHTSADLPLVVSRPQILVSELDLIAFVPEKKGTVEVEVQEVLFPKENAPVKPRDTIKVTNIAECHPALRGRPDVPDDWSGPGAYLLPLKKGAKKGEYQVVPIPPSPGFGTLDFAAALPGPPRLYPANKEARAQYEQIEKPTPEE